MHIVVAVLVSNHLPFLQRAVRSVDAAWTHYHASVSGSPVTVTPLIMVNTTHDSFVRDVQAWWAEERANNAATWRWHWSRTTSNGAPGKGHNACLDLLSASPTATWIDRDATWTDDELSQLQHADRVVMLDGDDAFYPPAFSLLSQVWDKDVVHLMVHDQVAMDRREHRHFCLDTNFFLYTAHGLPIVNHWLTQDIPCPFTTSLTECRTPSRLLVVSRRAAMQLRYDEECKLYDDYAPFLSMMHLQQTGELATVAVSHPDIYAYHACNDSSATLNFARVRDEERIFRRNVQPWMALSHHWRQALLALPFDTLQASGVLPLTLPDKMAFLKQEFVNVELQYHLQRAQDPSLSTQTKLKHWRVLERCQVQNDQSYPYIGLLRHQQIKPQLALTDEALVTGSSSPSSAFRLPLLQPVLRAFWKAFWQHPHWVLAKNLMMLYAQLQQWSVARQCRALALSHTDASNEKIAYETCHAIDLKIAASADRDVDPREAHSPDHDVEVVLYTGWSPPFHGDQTDQPVYGSELAAVNWAETWVAGGGGPVTICCHMSAGSVRHTVRGVTYVPLSTFPVLRARILIVSRFIHVLQDPSVWNRYNRITLWLHDARVHEWSPTGALPHDGRLLFRNVYDRLSAVVCVSEWQREWFTAWADLSDLSKLHVIHNGWSWRTQPTHAAKVPGRFIYASDPSRGLDVLLDMVPALSQLVPAFHLHVFFHAVPASMQQKLIQVQKWVTFHGRVPPAQLQHEWLVSEYMLYPLLGHETFCMNALDAQRHGVVVVAPHSTGLRSSVGPGGILVPGRATSPTWQHHVYALIKQLETQPAQKAELQHNARSWAAQQTWSHRRQAWQTILTSVTNDNERV